VKLCGHATLASAFVYFRDIDQNAGQIVFNSLSGPLSVSRDGDVLTLDFPQKAVEPVTTPPLLAQALGIEPLAVFAADDWLVLIDSETTLQALQPDMSLLKKLDRRGMIVTAKGNGCDFVSRFFAPKYGIDEDPVTGSAHTILAPFWAERLGRQKLHARQLSARGGELHCEVVGDRVLISGQAVPYLKGTITLPPGLLPIPEGAQ
jgi:PhzF family phenazine biosynthesis protein